MAMFKDAFVKLDKVQAGKIISAVNPLLDIKFDPDTAKVMRHDLAFYKGYSLVEISRHDENPPVVRNIITNNAGDTHLLDWSNGPIFELNKKIPITLNDETMEDYVRFFFTYVRGSHGRFLVIDTVDDIDWREEPAPAGRKSLGKMIEPLYLKRTDPDGTIVFHLSLIFKDSLFAAEARLQPDGMIRLKNEELLVEDIPVADDLFGQ